MQIEREELIKLLTRVKPAVGSGGLVPALSHVWFDTKAIFAYDGGFGIRLDHKTDLNCGVPGTPLISLLGTSALKEIALEPDKTALKVKLGKANTKLAMLNAEGSAWPFPVKPPKTATAVEITDEFVEGLRRTLFIKPNPPTRVEHYGVMVTKTKNDLYLHASDSATMAEVKLTGLGKSVDLDRVLLPRGFSEQIVSQAPEGAKLYVLKDSLIAQAEGVTFYSNLLDVSTADNMADIIVSQTSRHPDAIPLPAGLTAALNRADILAGPNEAEITLEVKGRNLLVSGDYSLGTVKEELELGEEHPAAKGRYSAPKLRRALPYAEKFSLTENSLFLRGEPGFSYLVGSL